MYQAVYGDSVDNRILEFYDGRFDLDKGKESEQVSEYLRKWGMDEYVRYAVDFFAQSNTVTNIPTSIFAISWVSKTLLFSILSTMFLLKLKRNRVI